jgi:hypothetical protein
MSKGFIRLVLFWLWMTGAVAAAPGGVLVTTAGEAPVLNFRPLVQWEDADYLDVVLVEEYAICARGYKGLAIIDISNPASPVRVAEVPLPGIALRVIIHEGFGFVANLSDGLQIVDISDPLNPVLVGGCPAGPLVYDVACRGDIAMLVHVDGLDVVAVSDPTQPQTLYRIDAFGPLTDVTIEGDIAYVTGGWPRIPLIMLDISDPLQPVFLGEYSPDASSIEQIEIREGLLYAATSDGLLVLDVGDPADPQPVGRYPSADLWTLALLDNLAVMSNSYGYFSQTLVLDVADPTRPHKLGVMGDVMVQGAAGQSDLLFLAAGEAGLRVVALDQLPDRPVWLGQTTIPGGVYRSYGVRNDLVYLQRPAGGLHLVDISDPAAPAFRGTILDQTQDALLVDDRLYTLEWDNSAQDYIFRIYAGTDPLKPWLLGQLPLGSYAVVLNGSTDLAVVGYGWFSSGNRPEKSGFHLVDTSDPAQPRLAGSWDWGEPGNWMTDAVIRGNTLYMVYVTFSEGGVDYTESGLLALDITDPSSPVLMSWLADFSAAVAIHLVNDHAVINDLDRGIFIMDLGGVDPEVVGYWPTYPYPEIAVGGNLLYVYDKKGLWVLDLSTAACPVLRTFRGEYGFGPWNDFIVHGDRLVALRRMEQVVVSDVENINRVTPTLGQWAPQWSGGWIYADDHVGYRYSETLGLCAFDLSDDKEPVLLSATPVGKWPVAMTGNAGLVVMADQLGVFHVVDVTDPAVPSVRKFFMPELEFDRLLVQDNWLYAVDRLRLTVLDLAASPVPAVVGVVDLPELEAGRSSLFYQDGVLLIPRRRDVLFVDVSRPASPVLLSRIVCDFHTIAFDLRQSLFYIATLDAGLRIFDVGDPRQPRLLSVFADGAKCRTVAAADGLAFALVDGEPMAVDMTDPGSPRELATFFPDFGPEIRHFRNRGNRLAVESPDIVDADWTDYRWGFSPEIGRFSSDVYWGSLPLTVTFQVTATDRDDDIAAYHWDFDGDGTVDRVTAGNTATFTYGRIGMYRARVKVEDRLGFVTESSPRVITVLFSGPWFL